MMIAVDSPPARNDPEATLRPRVRSDPGTVNSPPSPRGAARWRRRRSKLGVSTVVATILVLALTVTLFAVIFLALQRFPQPTRPNISQFSATLGYKPGSSSILSLSITHLSGPAVVGPSSHQAAIYVHSQNRSATYGPFLLAQGLPGGSTSWVFGQTWSCTTTCAGFPTLFAPDNLTVTLSASGALLFQEGIQALFPGYAPYFTQVAVHPTSGTSFQSSSPKTFTVTATVLCAASCNAVNPVSLNYSQFVGKGTPAVAMTCSPSGAAVENCTYTSSGVTSPAASGTYFLFLVATDSLGRSDTYTITVSVS